MLEYIFVGSAATISFFATLFSIKIIVPFAHKIGLVDIPDSRKLHTGNVPLIGGIAIFIGMLTSTTLIYNSSPTLNLYIISSALIVFIGVLDDYKELAVSFRLIAQTLVSCIMVYGAQIYIGDFGNILGLGDISLLWFGFPFTILAVIAAINAFNMSDGIDGLVGVLSLWAFLALAFLMLVGESDLFFLPLLLAFSTIPYLFFNLGMAGGNAKKIFMGDAGSMFVGLSIVWLLVSGSQGENSTFRPVVALWIIAVPLVDMISLTIRRIQRGRSPFKADRDHLHHLLMQEGFGAKQTLYIISVFAGLSVSAGVLMELFAVSETLMFALFVCMFTIYFLLTNRIAKGRFEEQENT